MTRSRSAFISVLAVGALALAACGGDDEAATAVSTAGGSATTAASAASESAGEQATAATGAAGDSTSAEGDPGSEYCRAVRGEIEMPADLGAIESLDFTDQEQVQSMLADAEANLARTVSIAPEELRADFQTVLESSMSMVAQLAENGGDFTKLDVTNFDNPEFMAAAERVEAYNADVCGYDAATAPLPAEVSADTMSATLEALLAPLKAQMNLSDDQVTCLSEKMAASMTEAGSAPDISAVMTYFTDCGINPAGG